MTPAKKKKNNAASFNCIKVLYITYKNYLSYSIYFVFHNTDFLLKAILKKVTCIYAIITSIITLKN
ncbi:hypothetical protein Hanom_Chr12g01181171 [Helianthus anomalus]